MANWQYKILDVSTSAIDNLQLELCGWGALGWEAVGYTDIEKYGPNTVSVLMKRQMPELNPPDDMASGWKPDPLTRFELRQWDGQRWGQRVMSDGTQDLDFPDVR